MTALDSLQLEDLELGGVQPAGWTHAAAMGTDDWQLGNERNQTPAGAFGSWRRTVVDLSAWNGGTVRFGWRLTSSFFSGGIGWWIDDITVRTHDEPCDAHACGIPGEVGTLTVAKDGSTAVLGWWDDPLCVEFRVWRSSSPDSMAGFDDVTGEDPDPGDCVFHDPAPGATVYWLVEGIGPDGSGPLGHFGP